MAKSDNNYWKSYLEASQNLFDVGLPGLDKNSSADQPNAYADALSTWWRKVSPQSPPTTQQLFDKLVEQSTAYFQFAEHLKSNGASDGKKPVGNWTSSALNILTQLEKSFSQANSPPTTNIDRVKKFIEQPFSAWQAFANAPSDRLPDLPELLSNLLSSPAIGMNREFQTLVQQYLKREVEYQQVLAEYQQFHNNIGIKSCHRLKHALSIADGGQEKSFRAIYNLWVVQCEGVYAEEVSTELFSRLYGNLINALMSLQQTRQRVVNKTLASFGLPTQKNNEELTQSLQNLRHKQNRHENEVRRLQLKCDQLENLISKTTRRPKERNAVSSKQSRPRSVSTKTVGLKKGKHPS
ncbi:class III poly(R)-hydroxyalkanoic acid synthase subunit PhaE [Pseudomonadota bacterium]